jgi:uncharacterized protein YodC (DUF2158 family)
MKEIKNEGIKSGDVVRLKSGGPLMTVIEQDEVQGIRCAWFNKEEDVKVGAFNAGILEKIE